MCQQTPAGGPIAASRYANRRRALTPAVWRKDSAGGRLLRRTDEGANKISQSHCYKNADVTVFRVPVVTCWPYRSILHPVNFVIHDCQQGFDQSGVEEREVGGASSNDLPTPTLITTFTTTGALEIKKNDV